MPRKFNPLVKKYLDYYETGGGTGATSGDGFNRIAAGTQTAGTLATVNFANSNGLTFGMSNSSQITASYTVPGATSFSNSNNVTFGLNGSTITASASFSQSIQTQNLHNVTLSGNTAGVMAQISSGTLTLAGGNNVTLSQDGNAVTVSGANQSVQTQGMVSINGGTGDISFSNSNGVSFGRNGSTITASHNGLTSQSNQAFSAGGGSSAFQTLNFRDANGISFSNSGGSVEASYTVPTQTNQTVGLYASSQTTGQSSSSTYDARSITLRGAGIVSVGNSGGEFIISATGGGAADGGVGISAGANSVSNGTVVFSNSNGVSFGLNGSTVTASHNGLTQQSTQPVALSGSNGSFNFSTATFGNLNGLSFYTSNGSMVGSYTVPSVPAQTNQTLGGYFVGNTTGQSSSSTVDARSVSIDGAGIVSAGWSNGSIRVSATQSNQAFSASGGSSTFQTLSFANGNGATFSNNGGSVQLSYTVPTVTNSSLTMQAGASTLSSVSRVAFGDGNGVSFGASTSNNGSITITASHNGLTSQSNQAFSAGGGSSAFQTLNFRDANGISFSNSNGSVQASYTVPTVTQYFSATNTTFNGTNVSGSLTLNTNGLRVDLSAGAGGGVTPVASASNGSFSFTTLGFSNANNVTFGTSAGSIVTASVAAPGAAAENNAINLLGANTAGNTTATGSTIGWSGVNLTLSGTNASQIAISAPATSSLSATGNFSISTNGSTISMGVPEATATLWYPYNEGVNVMGQQGNATWHFAPVPTPLNKGDGIVSIDQAVFPMFITNATNSTGTVTVSISMGLYTKNESSLSLAHSASGSFAVTFSGTVNNSTYAGIRLATIPFNTTFEGGRYYAGIAYRSTTGGANATVSQVLVSQLNSNFSGVYGSASNRSNQWPLGLGVRSASSSGFFSSIAFSQIDGTGSLVARPPSWHMRLGTA